MGYQAQTMRLYDSARQRLYVNAEERARFLRVTAEAHPIVRSLGQTLLYTGCRLSEALELTGHSIQAEAHVVTFRTLKRRSRHVYREVPVPVELIQIWQRTHDLQRPTRLFEHIGQPVHRVTAYRWIKALMQKAKITGAQATPKGLRHGFGVHAIRSGVPLNMVQKWMGHANMSTTAIYADATGADELIIANRMWAQRG